MVHMHDRKTVPQVLSNKSSVSPLATVFLPLCGLLLLDSWDKAKVEDVNASACHDNPWFSLSNATRSAQ